jgi:hypothetical protein
MSKIVEYKINRFDGGISDDPRESSSNKFVTAKHFDIFSFPNRLVPYRSLEADTNDGSTSTGMKQYMVKDFVYSSTDAKLYGLGQTGGGLTKIVYKADATSGNWTLPASSEGNGAVINNCFFEFKDYLLGFQGTNQIFKWGLLSGTPSITNSLATVASTITSVANGVIAADGNAYMAYNNVVVRISTAVAVTDSAKTVPTNYKITSLSNFGKYLAIWCAPISTFNGTSKVFLWDLSSDLFAETIDWGEGELRVGETIEGMLVGITDRYLNNSVGAGRGSMIIQMYQSGTPQVVKEVFTQKIVGKSIPQSKAVKNNRLFFAAKIMTNTAGTEYDEGLWSFGRKNVNSPFALNLDVTDENIDTDGIQAFGSAANFFFVTHSGDGSIDKTNDAATYDFDSIYESQIIDFGDPHVTKKLLGISVTSNWATSLGTVTTKYKIDGDTSWTTIGTFVNSGLTPIFQENYLNIESTGSDFASGKEYKFRIESTDGAEITGFKCRAQLINTPNS